MARHIPCREDATRLRRQVLNVGILMLDEEHRDLTRALHRTYLVYRERFLRDRGLMDTIDQDNDPRIRREWREARTNARNLQQHLNGRWTSAIIAEQRRTGVHRLNVDATATQDALPDRAWGNAGCDRRQEAIAVGIEHLSSSSGDIPAALYNAEHDLRRRLLDQHGAPVARTTAYELTRYINDHWALAVELFSL
jgi:hypothetical protein